MRKLYENSFKLVDDDCYMVRNKPFWRTGEYAAPCIQTSIKALIDAEYTRTGMCNFYTTGDVMHYMNMAMAFQVFINTSLFLFKDMSSPCQINLHTFAILEGKPLH